VDFFPPSRSLSMFRVFLYMAVVQKLDHLASGPALLDRGPAREGSFLALAVSRSRESSCLIRAFPSSSCFGSERKSCGSSDLARVAPASAWPSEPDHLVRLKRLSSSFGALDRPSIDDLLLPCAWPCCRGSRAWASVDNAETDGRAH